MARIQRPLGQDEFAPPEQCSICGAQSDSYWVGIQETAVCRSCAIRVLPKLIADAIVTPLNHRAHEHYDHVWKSAEAEFWKAISMAIAVATQRNLNREEPEAVF